MSLELWQTIKIPTARLRFSTTASSKKYAQAIGTPTTGNRNVSVFDGHIAISVRLRYQLTTIISQQFFSSSPWSKTPGSPTEFRWYLSYFRRHKCFRFWLKNNYWYNCRFRLSIVVGLCRSELTVVNDHYWSFVRKKHDNEESKWWWWWWSKTELVHAKGDIKSIDAYTWHTR